MSSFVSSTEPVPLSNDLITSVLDDMELKYFTDNEGDIGAGWDEFVVYFLQLGEKQEILHMRGIVDRSFEETDVPRLYDFCNEWNRSKLWPKAYVHVKRDDDGGTTVKVVGEVTTDLEHGGTFAQVKQLLDCGINTNGQLAAAVLELDAPAQSGSN